MENAAGLPAELSLLGWSVLLLLVHITVQAVAVTRETGRDYNVGPRDEPHAAQKPLTGRSERALRNFLETYPAFVGLALALAVSGEAGGAGAVGAHVWFWSRIVYLPLYLAGIPYFRSFVWTVSVAGLLVMLFALFT
ncbi:MAPEG family protein [Propylenella binzhouense]|uniref:MAPEG superfamily protein n=1 Tax=Propylenella binzhouense TaxID=2555902 RepID=A0A964WUR2_9HYPH|nr:MAPEG family protein [Propylenella binzhouense]MYZ49294.1 hypothetical protein [Propylenella binzhouense]